MVYAEDPQGRGNPQAVVEEMRIRRQLTELSRQELLRIATRDFQKCIRAEAGAFEGPVLCWVESERFSGVTEIFSPFTDCVCVTCGRVHPWAGSNKLDTGHAIPGRRQSIVFDERIVAPQCVFCNRHRGGYPQRFQEVVARAIGAEELAKIQRQANRSVTFDKSELLDKIGIYRGRIKDAIDAMG